MLEAAGDMWEIGKDADAIVITTNGTITKAGENVMGGGCAREAADRFSWLPKALATKLKQHGNHVFVFQSQALFQQPDIVTMPTKDDVRKPSEIELVKQSAYELQALTNMMGWQKVVMPRPGCGLGGLDWDEVKPILEWCLDDRFTVVTYG